MKILINQFGDKCLSVSIMAFQLLDWTYSSLVALHFSLTGEDFFEMQKHNCVIWKIDIEELNELLPNEYKEVLSKEKAYLFTVDMIETLVISIEEYDSDMKANSMVLIEPASLIKEL